MPAPTVFEHFTKNLARILSETARDLEDAAKQIRGLADQASKGNAGSYHHLASRALSIVNQIPPNLNLGSAFEHAAHADEAVREGTTR